MKYLIYLISLACFSLVYSDTWNPDPAQTIPGSSSTASIVNSAYISSLDEFITLWMDLATNNIVYDIYDGTTWSSPANIPGLPTASVNPFAASNSADGYFLVTWLSSSNFPTFATFDGTTWSSFSSIPSASSATTTSRRCKDG
jgi:hypothetical protein